MISEEVTNKLNRMRIINNLFREDEEYLSDDELMDEYRTLLPEMVKLFLPLVTALCEAGLLTVQIEDVDQISDINRYLSLTGDPIDAFDNGNIWLYSEYCGGTLLQNKSEQIRVCNENIFDR